jgi:putative photosynthetic complex assembly protein
MTQPNHSGGILAVLERERAFDQAHDEEHDNQVPKVPLYAAISLALLTLALVSGARLAGFDPVDQPAREIVARDLRFEDRPGGAVAVFDSATQSLVEVVPGGDDSFVRSTLRSMARDRRHGGAGSEVAFHLAGHADGRLTLTDPVTGRRLDLVAFGSDNAKSFSRWLPVPTAPSSVKVSSANGVNSN